jgi:uncharacterized protein involved in exopolysaccharide biosynthesis
VALLAVPLILGGLLGAGAFALTSPSYTAEARVGLGQPALAPNQVPAYAAALQTLASNYARFVQDSDSLRDELETQVSGEVVSAIASPIPETGIIRLEVKASDRASAVGAVNRLAQQLIDQVRGVTESTQVDTQRFSDAYIAYLDAQNAAAAASAEFDRLNTELGADPNVVAAARDRAGQAAADAALRNLEQQALGTLYRDAHTASATAPALTVIREAASASDDTGSRAQRTIGIGALLGAAISVGLAYLLGRRGATARRRGPHRMSGGGSSRDLGPQLSRG